MPAVEELRRAHRALRTLDDRAVIEGLSRALSLWKGPEGVGVRAARELHALRGLSEEMIRFGLGRLLRTHTPGALEAWLSQAREEAARLVAERSATPGVEPGPLTGPRVVTQILAGNVAGLALHAIMEALLARSAVLIKPASAEPVTARRFKESLDQAAPELGRAVEVSGWKGGDRSTEDRVFRETDFVIASGGEEMASSLTSRLPAGSLLFGPRLSVGVVGSGWRLAPERWWEETAREIVLWEQEGCLSPRILFVAGSHRRFSEHLARALAAWEEQWPARPRTAGEAAAIHGYRARYETSPGSSSGLLAPDDTAWTVVWDNEPSLEAGPPHRVVRVTRRLPQGEMLDLLREHRGEIQGLGTARLASHEAGWRRVGEQAGIPRVAPLSSVQDPPAGWRADGRSGLAELLASGTTSG